MPDIGLAGPKRYVPIWDKVHVPDWAAALLEHGPHDTPFHDGISGEIGLTLHTITPLAVGGHQEDVKVNGNDDGKRKHWAEINANRIIPGTSVKGTIRSVLETATMGRFGSRLDDRRLSIRDLHNADDYISHLTDMFRPLSRAGWLTPERNGWSLQPCEWSLVRQADLEKRHEKNIQLGKRQSAKEKYRIWGWNNLDIAFDPLPVSTEGPYARGRHLSRVANLFDGQTDGRIVFTGQPQDRVRNGRPNKTAKSTEFIFHGISGHELTVPHDLQRDFESIHRDESGEPNTEWGMWLDHFRRGHGKVPVFWLEDADGHIKAMGLSMMFRLPYSKTLREAATQEDPNTWDMADLIFGRVNDAENATTKALKGRANFTHFTQACNTALMPEQETNLLAPKYGFYPALIRQENAADTRPLSVQTYKERPNSRPKNLYTTLQHPEARLRGPSRYKASRGYDIPKPEADHRGVINRKIITRLRPLKPGATFTGSLRIFNLKPVELGALLWVLLWGGDKDNPLEPRGHHAHSLGAGKAFGLGACRIELDFGRTTILRNDHGYVEEQDQATQDPLKQALSTFTDYMSTALPGWEDSLQIRELLTIADLDRGDEMRRRGELQPMRSPKDFVDAKKEGYILPLASGGYEVALKPPTGKRPSATASAATPSVQPQQQATGGLRFRKGQRVENIEEGETVTVMEDVPHHAKDVLILFDGEEEAERVTSGALR